MCLRACCAEPAVPPVPSAPRVSGTDRTTTTVHTSPRVVCREMAPTTPNPIRIAAPKNSCSVGGMASIARRIRRSAPLAARQARATNRPMAVREASAARPTWSAWSRLIDGFASTRSAAPSVRRLKASPADHRIVGRRPEFVTLVSAVTFVSSRHRGGSPPWRADGSRINPMLRRAISAALIPDRSGTFCMSSIRVPSGSVR